MECIDIIVPTPLMKEVAEVVTTYKLANEIVGISGKDDIQLRILFSREQTFLVLVILIGVDIIREINANQERLLREEEEHQKLRLSKFSSRFYDNKNTDAASGISRNVKP